MRRLAYTNGPRDPHPYDGNNGCDSSRLPIAGTGRSTESGLEHTGYDSGEEIEAIRRSVTSLRAQRVAVEQLKEKAQRDETTAGVLRRKLRDAESRVEELRAQGGRDVVRRLMNEVRAALALRRLFLCAVCRKCV